MSEFRKKPVVIDAFQWTGGPDQIEDPAWACEAVREGSMSFEPGVALIHTLEGVMRADVGDWIIRGVKGEIYPCKPDIFAATYDAVEDGGDEDAPSAVIEMLARMWMTCDPNRGGSDPDEIAPLHVDGKEQLLPRWRWFVPRAEASLRFFAKHGYRIEGARG